MLPAIISKLGLPILVSLIGSALGRIDNPVARSASEALSNFEGALAGGAISAEQMAEANRHAESMAAMKAQENSAVMAEINESLRAEVASSDVYVRRMRPTFGYLLAFTWAMQMGAVSYVMIFRTEHMPVIIEGMEGLSTIWAVALSVLGIYVYKRSEEKKGLSSYAPKGTSSPATEKPPVQNTSNIKPSTAPPSYND